MGFYGNATYYLPNGIAQDVVDGVVVESKLADDAVTTKKIKNGSITAEKISLNVIKGGSAGTGHLALNTITKDNMDKDSVGSDQIVDRSVTVNKVANNAITADKIADTSIYGNANDGKKHIAKETITGGEGGNIAPNTITSYNMGNDSILTVNIKNGNITTEKIADGAVNADKIMDTSIYGNANNGKKHIAPNTIAGGEGGNIAPNTITGGNIAQNTITSYNMADNSILTANIENGSVTTEKIADEAIIPNKLDRTYHEMHLIDVGWYDNTVGVEPVRLAEFITEKYLETKNTAICFHSRPNNLDKIQDAPQGYYKITYAGEILGGERSTTYWWKLEILAQKALNPPEEQKNIFYFIFNYDSATGLYDSFKLIPASTWVLRNYLKDYNTKNEIEFNKKQMILDNFPLSDINKNYFSYIKIIKNTTIPSNEQSDLRYWWNSRLENDSTIPQAGDYLLMGDPNRQSYYLFGMNNAKHYILFCRIESGQNMWFTKEVENNSKSIVIEFLDNAGPTGNRISDIVLFDNAHYDLMGDDGYLERKTYYIKNMSDKLFSGESSLITKYKSNTIMQNLTTSSILLDLQGSKQIILPNENFNFPEGFPTECILYLNFKRLSNDYIYCECKYWEEDNVE